MKQDMSRRSFLKIFGAGTVATAATLAGCKSKAERQAVDDYIQQVEPPVGKMTYRQHPITGDKVSLLGYEMMRLPMTVDYRDEVDQKMVNRLVDYAIEHGVNYFDTAPAYCMGLSESSMGEALSHHQRSEYLVATKLSNLHEEYWSREESIRMYKNSLKNLRVDYLDYYLLQDVGMGGMETFNRRFIDNGVLGYLVEEREAGHIRNLGFSFHGDITVFDELLQLHDAGKYHWDFVQIELNYLDWDYANEINDRNTNSRYLYEELLKRSIPVVIMEPLSGGRLANLPQNLATTLKKYAPQRSGASWAFRYAGTPKGVLTVLSGMTYMEQLKDALLSFCPFLPLTSKEQTFLQHHLAEQIVGLENVPCVDCKDCMPCPYGIDIPAIFKHYNKCVNEGTLPQSSKKDKAYWQNRRRYLIGLDRAVSKDRQPDHCIGCGQCEPYCPQNILIPRELHKISEFIEELKRSGE